MLDFFEKICLPHKKPHNFKHIMQKLFFLVFEDTLFLALLARVMHTQKEGLRGKDRRFLAYCVHLFTMKWLFAVATCFWQAQTAGQELQAGFSHCFACGFADKRSISQTKAPPLPMPESSMRKGGAFAVSQYSGCVRINNS